MRVVWFLAWLGCNRQDFNINQLIKHRNDLKEKMDNIKEDMEFGLERDKEKLKSLALMSHQNYKVHCHANWIFLPSLLPTRNVIYDILTCFYEQRLVKFSKMGENIIQLIKFCEHLELSHKLTENGDSNRNYANLAMNESLVDSARNEVRNASGDREFVCARRWTVGKTQCRRRFSTFSHLFVSSFSFFSWHIQSIKNSMAFGSGWIALASTVCAFARTSQRCCVKIAIWESNWRNT